MGTRREFIRGCCAAASMGVFAGFGRFGLLNALAAAPADYKALVCIFLFGGNDANNLLVPMSDSSSVGSGYRYSDYIAIRAAQSSGGLGLTQAELTPTVVQSLTSQPAPSNQSDFAFHPSMTQIRNLFQTNKKVAVVTNMGVLKEPTTRAQYLSQSSIRPANLFSHSDQQLQWQTSDPTGFGTTGWAGRTADRIRTIFDVSAVYPPITTVAGTALFCTGSVQQPFALAPTTNPATIGLAGYSSGSAQSQARLASLQQMLTFDSGVQLIQATSSITDRALQQSEILAGALQGVTLATAFPSTSIGNQLAQVARILKANDTIGLSRQIFFCSMGGYDTHTGQIPDQNNLLGQLDAGMKAFYDATLELNLQDKVTTFTLSEFGRTLKPAAGAGSDHGWGGHQLVMGGAVLGGTIYGRMPKFVLGGADPASEDSSSLGRFIPSTSVDQFGATLARWFGVPDADLNSVFPNLPKFPTSNLGFLP